MEFKDYFYIFGIIVSFSIGLFNVRMMLKNRRNSMREHIYKEQLNIISELFIKFSILNREIDSLVNNSQKRFENTFEDKFNLVGELIFENQFILPNDIITLANNTLTKSEKFYSDLLNMANTNELNTYEEYYKRYFELLIIVRGYYGIDSLSKENQKIHGIPSFSEINVINKVTEK